jgi:NTP pyrophosphatase (non-canonical NTP hydrolase)
MNRRAEKLVAKFRRVSILRMARANAKTEEFGPSFARLAEELGELAEAVRIFRSQPGYFLSEAADVFAWLMHIQNSVDSKAGVKADTRGNALEIAMSKAYPHGCKDCGRRICICPPILPSTIGRIAHEVPTNRGTFDETGRFMTPERASEFFQRT